MDKIRITKNYNDYKRVQEAFKGFIDTLVKQSMEVDNGVYLKDVNEFIEKYCNSVDGEQMITLANDCVSKYAKGLGARYEVHLYEMDEDGNANEETAKHFNTDNVVLAFKKAAEFYRTTKYPQVNIYDNEINQYIAEWD